MLREKLIKRKVSLKRSTSRSPRTEQGRLAHPLEGEGGHRGRAARKIIKWRSRTASSRSRPSIQDAQVRVTGKNKDDLQKAIALVRRLDLGIELQFMNFRESPDEYLSRAESGLAECARRSRPGGSATVQRSRHPTIGPMAKAKTKRGPEHAQALRHRRRPRRGERAADDAGDGAAARARDHLRRRARQDAAGAHRHRQGHAPLGLHARDGARRRASARWAAG